MQILTWDTPLSSHFLSHDDSGTQSLKRFISSAVSSLGDELDLVIDRNKDILEHVTVLFSHSRIFQSPDC